jgi:hypothetical protein|eukprot:COSAG06_NODE_1601_length_8960_cov_10.596998_3_plen_43_part_00
MVLFHPTVLTEDSPVELALQNIQFGKKSQLQCRCLSLLLSFY